MALFRYEAVDKTGKVLHGVMNASNEQQVAANLTQMGYAMRAVYSDSSKIAAPQRTVTAPASILSPRAPASPELRSPQAFPFR